MSRKRGGIRQDTAEGSPSCPCLAGLSALLLALLLIGCFGASQDSLRTTLSNTIYGLLVDQEGKPVVGEVVIAQWKDENGVLQEARTSTLTMQEADALGNAGLEGHFIFSQGIIAAPLNSTITIRSQPRYSVLRFPSSSRSSIDVGRLTVLRALPTSPSQDIVTLDFEKDLHNETKGDESLFIEDALSLGAAPSVPIEVMDEQGVPIEGDARILLGPEIKKIGLMGELGAVFGPKGSFLVPSSSQENPWLTLRAQWQDKEGATSDATLHILSLSESDLLGDGLLEGKVLAFGAPADAALLKVVIGWRPDEASDANSAQNSIEDPIISPEDNATTSGPLQDSTSTTPEIRMLLWSIAGFGALLAFSVFIIRRKKSKTSLAELFASKAASLDDIAVGQIMSRQVHALSEDANISEALNLMMDHHVNAIVITSNGAVKGILTEGDFLHKVYFTDHSQDLKIKEVMSTKILTTPIDTSITHALGFMLEHNLRKLPVVRDGKLIGLVTATDIIRTITAYFHSHPDKKQAHGSASVHTHSLKSLPIPPQDEPLISIIHTMRTHNMGFALTTPRQAAKGEAIHDHDAGIITTKDLLDEYHKNPHGMSTLKGIHVKRSPLWTIDSSKTVSDALELMNEHHIRRLPLVQNGRIIGLIGQKGVLESIMQSLERQRKHPQEKNKAVSSQDIQLHTKSP